MENEQETTQLYNLHDRTTGVQIDQAWMSSDIANRFNWLFSSFGSNYRWVASGLMMRVVMSQEGKANNEPGQL
jgi:hypothetical protein